MRSKNLFFFRESKRNSDLPSANSFSASCTLSGLKTAAKDSELMRVCGENAIPFISVPSFKQRLASHSKLFAILFVLTGLGFFVGCVGSGAPTQSNCIASRPASCPSCSQNSVFRGQTPCQTCPASSVSQCSGGMYRNTITVSCCNPTALWEAMVIPVRKYFTIKTEVPCRQIGNCINQGTLITNRTIGSTIFEPWRGDTVGRQQRWESTLHTIARQAVINVTYLDHNQYSISVIVKKEMENTDHVKMYRNGQDNYFLSDSRRTFTDPLFSSKDKVSNQWDFIGQDPLLEQRLLADIEQSIRARCR